MKQATKELMTSLTIQRRVIYALFMREVMTRFGRHNIGFLWLFVEPMIFTLGITALWTAMKSIHGSNLPITPFALTGYSSVLLWRNMPVRTIGAIPPNLSLMFHRNVRVMDIYIARLLLEVAGATMSFILLSILFISIGMVDPPEDILKVAWGWFMLAYCGMSMALMIGTLSEQSELVDKIWHPLAYLIFPISGAGFIVEALPVEAQKYVLYIPMVHGVEYLREGYFGSRFHAIHDLSYMALVSTGMLLFGLVQMRVVAREVVPE
ncbi:ABC transporter permease [Novosphingobium lentum]|uniref:ABC transporter permease n=1 Tax=Novosphingobium lentum TaxID=145287 RepID=UPI000ABB6924|nr:ABC transporter permease [Novosphingobium lentum]